MFFISKKHYPSYVFYPGNARLHNHPHCGVLCRPHRTVRTAPVLKAEKLPHNHNYPTIHFNLFCRIFGQKIFSKRFQEFFFQNIEKKHNNELHTGLKIRRLKFFFSLHELRWIFTICFAPKNKHRVPQLWRCVY